MSRVEERALEAYPPTFTSGKRYAKRVQSEKVDTHAPIRSIFIKGYEQAEKDMMEQVMECELVCLKDRLLAVLPIKEFQWTVGDKIKIIIVKEDKS